MSLLFYIIWWICWLCISLICVIDAKYQGKSGILVFLLVFLGSLLGVIIWILIRPEKLY